MRLKDITPRYSIYSAVNKMYRGKYRKFEVLIYKHDDIWYFTIDSKDKRDIRYNCLWDDIKFENQEDCVVGSMKYIEKVSKNDKAS